MSITLSAQDLVAEARRSIEEIDTSVVQQRVAAGAALIDVREPAEFAVGHIPGAVNIPRGILEFEVFSNPAVGGVTATELSKRSRPLILYCRSGGRAALAAHTLKRMSFGNVASIAGGLLAWESSGYSITTGK
jgi:rhodanese-related sulfurtransferase